MSKTLNSILANCDWVAYIDDERNDGNSIIVTLEAGWFFADEPNCGIRGFDTVAEVQAATRQSKVVQKFIKINFINFRHNAPLNPEFLGAAPARIGEDY
jgi:hypothetical protein